jgi:hypothetical protein
VQTAFVDITSDALFVLQTVASVVNYSCGKWWGRRV